MPIDGNDLNGQPLNHRWSEFRCRSLFQRNLSVAGSLLFQAKLGTQRAYFRRRANRNSVYETLKRACERAGIEYLTPHQAGRHTFATNLLAAGKSLAFVKDAGHWSSGRLVMDTYGHLEQSDIRKSSAEVGGNWGKAILRKVK